MSEVFWLGPIGDCDICKKPVGDEFVDGKTVFGPWAIMCLRDFKVNGRGLGVGKGQKYVKQADGKYKKVEG